QGRSGLPLCGGKIQPSPRIDLMSETKSIIEFLGIPPGFGEILLALSFGLLLSPYLSGVDFGVLKVPVFSENAKTRLKIVAPFIFVACVFLYIPVVHTPQNVAQNLSSRRFDLQNLPSRGFDVDAKGNCTTPFQHSNMYQTGIKFQKGEPTEI